LTKSHRQGHMVKVDWLDRLTFREIEMINESEKRSSNFMYLMIEFRCVKCDDKEYAIDGDEASPIYTSSEIVKVPDPQMSMIIVSYPPTKQLTYEEQDLVWKFRYYLTHQEKALTKFLKCVNWHLPQEAKQALELLGKWKPMDVEDSLELLSSQFTNPTVRRYAVARLQQADDEDLLMYLLQLVQALKYENFDDIKSGLEPTKKETQGSVSETLFPSFLPLYQWQKRKNRLRMKTLRYVIVECEDRDTQQRDPKTHEMYLNVMRRFSQALLKGDKSVRVMRSLLAAQQTFVDRLVHVMKAVHRENGNRKKKNDRLQTLLADNEKMNLSDIEPIPLPLEPQVKIRGIIPEKATLFKSALMPAQLFFKTEDGDSYPVIFKHGDDLRQDQLILQIISLMDKVSCSSSSQYRWQRSSLLKKASSAEVMDTYVKSCAGYCVITYILGVGDRHLDNLLLTKTVTQYKKILQDFA
ncbi:putative Phosphatidylinositol 3-kinase catalytic subunit type 3-like protein, partial [Naja naja]